MKNGENSNDNLFKKFVSFFQVWLSKFTKDRVPMLASGIVYTTLISIIPFVSFLVAFLSLFDLLRPFYSTVAELFTTLFGDVAGGQLAAMIESFSKNASGLGIFGLISFSITSVLLINKVWSVINQIYRSSYYNMNVVRRSVVFFSTLIVGVFLLTAYFAVKSIFSKWTMTIFGWEFYGNFFTKILRFLSPILIGWLFLFFMIQVAPNAKVNPRSAAIGAFVGALGMYLVNITFSAIISRILKYSVIYGSFAAVFFFLLWVHIIWIVIFGAVEVSYVHQYRPGKETIAKPIMPAEQLANGINVMMVIGQKYRLGRGPTRIRDITDRLLMNERQLYTVLDLLEEMNFIITVNATKTAFVPAKPLENLKVYDLVSGLYGRVYLEQNIDTIGDSIATQISANGIKDLTSLSVANLVERL